MEIEIRDRWVAELRSGRYNKGRGFLCVRNDDDKYYHCVSGILCEVLGVHKKADVLLNICPYEIYSYKFHIDGHIKVSNKEIPNKYFSDIDTMFIDKVTRMNDRYNHTFSELADFIEDNISIDKFI